MPCCKSFHLWAILLLFCGISTYAQPDTGTVVEKVYLHTDRETYVAGDDLWFKAYLVNAQTNEPTGNSTNLYTELINAQNHIVHRVLIRLDDGLGNGDFKLADTLTAGKYRLRAYTNYMRNFGQSFVFEKHITIISALPVPGATVAKTKPVVKPKLKSIAVKNIDTVTHHPTVQFFPEGGAMVEGVSSLIAVKAEDAQGHGIPVRGVVLSAGVSVATFRCDSLGMGLFTLQPLPGKAYEAVVTLNCIAQHFNLPGILQKGFVLSMVNVGTACMATVSCNSTSLTTGINQQLTLKATHAGEQCFAQNILLKGIKTVVQVPLIDFPDGVVCFTLFDEKGRPLSERLVYIHNNSAAVKLNLTTDKVAYASREQVTLKLELDRAVKANLSVAVVDASIAPLPPENIASYLNLSSELKGVVERPAGYFDLNNPKRFAQLDRLLLTQGWRDYTWKELENHLPKITYASEQGITLTGQVRRTWRDKPLPGMHITMFAPKATGQKLFSAVSDSAGRFTIPGATLYGYQFLNFTARTGKGKGAGWIRVDSLPVNRLDIAPLRWQSEADTAFKPTDSLLAREVVKQKASLTGVNQLEAVTVKGYSPLLAPEILPITALEHKEYINLSQYLMYKIPGAHMDYETMCKDPAVEVQYIYRIAGIIKGEPIKVTIPISGAYTDGSRAPISYCDNNALSLSMDKILKVTLIKRESISGLLYSVILVVRPGAFDDENYFSNAMADVNGYYKTRMFYAPQHNTPNTKPDYRTTLHWEPNMVTNDNGEATLTFYNADAKGTIRIIAQGITSSGMPVWATKVYDVK